jgi:hypothetical protein
MDFIISQCDSRPLRWVLRLFGRKIVYACEWGVYDFLYDTIDLAACRPVHPNMSVAPPWATAKIVPLDVESR